METLSIATQEVASGSEVVVLKVEGSLDINTIERFEARLQELVKKKRNKIIINMENLSHISSVSIGVLMNSIQQIMENHGDIILTNVNREIYGNFELLELPGTFQILNTEQDALNAFGLTAYGDNE